ncbi:myomodulin neuropeptides 2-like [Haliotis cracherodii]|uniref:myomodulin neuropeptides 2-like n=1 Tax=Haliotis rufescens TaxID=6454 RepID=UPI001EB07848|nr:myomodulin neuropeptides 2-like [Haliotis rufescens]
MMQLYHLCWLGLLVIVYTGSCYAAASDDESEAETSHTRVRRNGWSMYRLGRGLQMLRLGKRGLPMIRLGRTPSSDSALTPEEIRYLLTSIMDDSKTLSSRQVPVPRYGKDLDYQTAYEQSLGDEEDEKIMRRSASPLEIDEGVPRLRPAPRGGRFRRSVLSQFTRLSEKLKELQNRERAVALPRIGRFSKERAVPIPRIG